MVGESPLPVCSLKGCEILFGKGHLTSYYENVI